MKLLKNNWQLKLASLIIGILLWSYIMAGVNPTQSLNVAGIPVIITNQDRLSENEYQITSMSVDSVSARVVGKRNELGQITPESIKATVDAANLHEGTQSVPLQYSAPGQLVLSETSTNQIEVTVEKIIRHEKPVTVEQIGQLPDHYVLKNLNVTPQTIEVTGPRSAVDQVAAASVSVDVSALTADSSANREVRAVDANGNVVDRVRLSLASVNVTATVVKQKEVPIRLKLAGTSPDNRRILDSSIAPNTVLIMGKPADVDRVNAIETRPLDISNIKNDGLFSVTLNFPNGITPVNPSEVKAQITLEAKEARDIDIPANKVQVDNGEGRTYAPVNPDLVIRLRVEGFPSDLGKLTSDTIPLLANAKAPESTGPTAGTVTLPLAPAAVQGIKVLSITPKTLTFKVSAS